jgi:type IV secretory pathway VirB6-like protein
VGSEYENETPHLPLPGILFENFPRFLLTSEVSIGIILFLYLSTVLSGEFAFEFVIFSERSLVEDTTSVSVESGSSGEDGSRGRRSYKVMQVAGSASVRGSHAMDRNDEKKTSPERGAKAAGL